MMMMRYLGSLCGAVALLMTAENACALTADVVASSGPTAPAAPTAPNALAASAQHVFPDLSATPFSSATDALPLYVPQSEPDSLFTPYFDELRALSLGLTLPTWPEAPVFTDKSPAVVVPRLMHRMWSSI